MLVTDVRRLFGFAYDVKVGLPQPIVQHVAPPEGMGNRRNFSRVFGTLFLRSELSYVYEEAAVLISISVMLRVG